MSGLHKTMRKIKPKEGVHMQVSRKVDETMEDSFSSMTPKVPASSEEDDKVIPLPDEEELKRIQRRKGRGGGRAATVLTSDDERLGG